MEWIDVKDRLPEEGTKVLVLGEQIGMNPQMGGAYIFISERLILKYESKNKHLRDQFDENNFKYARYVTHWMLLPKRPKP